MSLTKKKIRDRFTVQDFSRGKSYYERGRVSEMEIDKQPSVTEIQCEVRGTSCYQVVIQLFYDKLQAQCSCPRFADGYYCKHIAAALHSYFQDYNGSLVECSTVDETDRAAAQLLKKYLDKAGTTAAPDEPVHLKPRLSALQLNYPALRLFVGRDRFYAVQNVEAFVRSVFRRETVAYGKGLSFCHAIENFDSDAQTLIRILLDVYPQHQRSYYGYTRDYYASSQSSHRYIVFEGDSFDRLFDLLLGKTLECERSGADLLVRDGDPQVTVQLQAKQSGATLSVLQPDVGVYFGDGFRLYAICDNTLLRCTTAFAQEVYPLISAAAKQELRFSERDLPTLCGCVLPHIDGLAELEDDGQLMAQYMPDLCTASYYFDLDPMLGLTGEVRYQYGEQTVDGNTPPEVKRNKILEQTLRQPLERVFSVDASTGRYYIQDEDEIIAFLSGGLATFQENGDVYLSEGLRSKRISTARRPAVGISVSDGLLTLELDTGEFPPEELEALYQSLLKKKRYHKLRDGRFLPLDGSSYEKLAEVAHMTQLTEKQLQSGTVKLPAFRALYLDQVLGKREDLQVRRNDGYRRLVRDFKSMEDGEYSIPPEMEPVLRPYQAVGFQWMKTLEHNGFGGILADEMGLGKTIQTIAFLMTATRAEKGLPSLVVCPASLILNWADELAHFAPSLRPLVLLGTAAERKLQREQEQADVWITSYDLLKRDISDFQTRQFYCCLLDEGQNIKNQSTLTSKAVKQLVCTQRFVLTGTPIENRLSELWNIFDFLMPGYLFSHTAFVKRIEKPIVQSGDPAAQRQLGALVQPFMLRRLKQDVLKELPPKIEHVRRIALSDEERKTYQAAAYAARITAEKTKEKLQILALLMKLRQICCDPAICFENYRGQNSKLDACVELCASMAANGHQILLFSQFTTMLDRIRARLEQEQLTSFTIEGSTPKEKRAHLVKAFNAGGANVFLISLKAGGTGLNLTGADVVIHYDPWWNLAAQNQATDRAHRIGQKNYVQVYKLISQDTIEEKILRLQEKKASLMDAITGEPGAEPLTREELLALLE